MTDWKQQGFLLLTSIGLTLRLSSFQLTKALLGATLFAISLHVINLFERRSISSKSSSSSSSSSDSDSDSDSDSSSAPSPFSKDDDQKAVGATGIEGNLRLKSESEIDTVKFGDKNTLSKEGNEVEVEQVTLKRNPSNRKLEIQYEVEGNQVDLDLDVEKIKEREKPYLFVCVKCDISRNTRYMDDMEDIINELNTKEKLDDKKDQINDIVENDTPIVTLRDSETSIITDMNQTQTTKKEKKSKVKKAKPTENQDSNQTSQQTSLVPPQTTEVGEGVVEEKKKLKTGKVLYSKVKRVLEENGMIDKVNLVPSKCLSMCDNANCIAVSHPDKYSYQFGDLDHRDSAEDILRFVEMYLNIEDGYTKTKLRPKKLGKTILARLPPLDIKQATLEK